MGCILYYYNFIVVDVLGLTWLYGRGWSRLVIGQAIAMLWWKSKLGSAWPKAATS